jgi:hypothetical protein
MSVPMKTGIPLLGGKGRAPPKNNSDERPVLWVVRWTREVSEEQTEDVAGFTTCYADTTICRLLKFNVDFHGAYDNINALKTEKVALTSQAESLLQPGQSRRSGPQKELADPKTAMYWINANGQIDKTGNSDDPNTLTLGCKSYLPLQLLNWI